MLMEAQQHHAAEDVDDDLSPGSRRGKTACVAGRPAVNHHQPHQRLKEQHTCVPKSQKGDVKQRIRSGRQRCQQGAPWLSLVLFLYIIIYRDSPYLSWLGPNFALLPSAQDVVSAPKSSLSPDQYLLHDRVPDVNVSLMPFTFQPLPLGSIAPLGWLADQLHLMSDGLAGHQYDFYHFVHDSVWLDGHSEYSVLNEGLPYWFNGLVPLAYGLNDSRLIQQVEDASDFIIDHQQSDGWLGPETELASRDLWGRFPLFLGFIQLVEADPSRAAKIIPAMQTFVNLMHSMLEQDIGFEQIWGRVRYPDMLISLQWLYENYPEGNQAILLHTMHLLQYRSFDWSEYWTEGTFLFNDLDTIQPPIEDGRSPLFPFTHGVNAAQGLKAGATIYRFTANESLLDNNRNGVNWTFTYHGDPAGSVIGDERESGLNANRGSELCTAVETMFSMSYLYQALGDNYFGDRCELAAFNALPVSITGNHWARQYLSLASEPYSDHLTSPNPFWNVGEWGIIYGLEPNYPCCTVNMPQGLPKFLSASFVRVGEDGIGHALLGPSQLTTTTLSNVSVIIACNTNYPFSSTLHYNITSSGPFTLHLRVPSWSILANSSIHINNNNNNTLNHPLTPNPQTGMTPIPLPAGINQVTYTLPSTIRILPRANSTISIYHGSLLYALDIGQSTTTTTLNPPNIPTPHKKTTNTNTTSSPLPLTLPPQVHDYTYTNTKPWNIALDPSTLVFHHTTTTNETTTALPNPIFDYAAPPTYITGKGCQIEWPMYRGLPAPLAALPDGVRERKCSGGGVVEVVLRPYGSLKVHMAELPVVDLAVGVV